MPTLDPNRRRHALVALVAVALMVLFAGCSAAGLGSPAGTSTAAGTPTAAGTSGTGQPRSSQSTGEPTTAATTTAAASAHRSTSTPPASTPSTPPERGNATANESAASDAPASMASSGVIRVVVDGKRLNLSGGGGPVSFAPTSLTWYGPDPVNATPAEALASQNVTLGDGTLRYDGTTYREGPNTTVSVRVDRREVDPTTYRLEDGDRVWIVVNSPNWTPSPPGEYIHDEDYHAHGTMRIAIDGERLNLAKDRYQSQDRYFHFENGNETVWHAHSTDVTLTYALGTLGMNVTGDSVTYNDTTYRDGQNANVTIRVNGHAVDDPSDYVLEPGDHVWIAAERRS